MVAWEEQLEERSVPAWRDKYVAYGKLKRMVERTEKVVKGSAPDGPRQSTMSDPGWRQHSFGTGGDSLETPLVDAEVKGVPEAEQLQSEFMDDVRHELTRVSEWYKGMILKLEHRTRTLHDGRCDDIAGAAGLGRHSAPGCREETEAEEIASLHLEAINLTEFAMLNAEGLRKIVKKMDKVCNTKLQASFVSDELATSALANPSKEGRQPAFDGERARMCRRSLEDMVSPETLQELRSNAMKSHSSERSAKSTLRPRRVLVSIAVAGVTAVAGPRVLPSEARAQRCLVLMFLVVSLWVTEAAPFEATAMLVPPLAVALKVLEGAADDCAKRLLASVFNDSLYLVLCGFVISSIFSRCQLDSRAAASLQRSFGQRPFMFLLAVMFLGVFLSALVSNVTAPLLLIEVLKPLLRDLPTDSRYSRALLLGLAFACNVGGMMTPISSPQNVAALQTLRGSGGHISWAQWLSVSLPFCAISVVLAWAVLLVVYAYDYSDAERERDAIPAQSRQKRGAIPEVVFEREVLTPSKIAALCSASATLLAFAYSPAAGIFGGTPSTALFFVAVGVGTGWVSRQTFNAYSWHLLFLIGGGNALGLCIRESGLLSILTSVAREHLASSPWLLVCELVMVLLGVTTFVSHTVAALVLMPLVVELGSAAGVRERAVLIGAFACSCSCALPMTSFPNVNSLMATDDRGQPWLSVKNFLTAGTPLTLCLGFALATVGYFISSLVC